MATYFQNRRQKVFNRGLCVSAEGSFGCVQGGLDTLKLTKAQPIYSVSTDL